MARIGLRGWLLLSGFAALVPAAVLYRRFILRGQDDGKRDDSYDDVAIDAEQRAEYHSILRRTKEKGNAEFQQGHYDRALELYQGCVDMCAALGPRDAVAAQVDHAVRSNLVLVYMRLRRPDEARMLATFLLQDERRPVEGELKVKVLFRRGAASEALGDRESALCDYRAAVSLSPKGRNPEAEKAIAALLSK